MRCVGVVCVEGVERCLVYVCHEFGSIVRECVGGRMSE